MQEHPCDGVDNPWRQITEEQLATVLAQLGPCPKAASATLAEALALSEPHADVRQSARLTFTTTVLSFAQERRMPPVKAAVVFNVCQTLLATAAQAMARSDAQQGSLPLNRSASLEFPATGGMAHLVVPRHGASPTVQC